MDENLRETTELPESGETAPNEENEPETKSIRFVPSAYDPRGIEQWLSERAAEGKLLLRYDDFVIGEPRDCRYHLEPAADDDDPDELLREKRARLGWEYVCRTKDGIFYIWRGDRTAHVPTPKDCTDSYGYRRLCKKLRRSYFLPLLYLVADVLLIYFLFYVWSIPLLSLLTMPKNDVIQGVSLLLGSIIGMFSGAQERKEMRTLKRAMEDCERVEKMPRNRWTGIDRALSLIVVVLMVAVLFGKGDTASTAMPIRRADAALSSRRRARRRSVRLVRSARSFDAARRACVLRRRNTVCGNDRRLGAAEHRSGLSTPRVSLCWQSP